MIPNGVFAYTDARALLQDFVRLRKSETPTWSYGVWARQLKLKSPSTLIMITNGQRNPGPDLVRDLCRYFHFNDAEADYFRSLVKLSKVSRDVRRSIEIMKHLERANPRHGFRLVEHERFETIANWRYFAIREMVNLADWREDPKWISQRSGGRITVDEARRALYALIDLDLLSRNAAGRLVTGEGHVDTPTDQAHEGVKRFHRDAFENARAALDHVDPREREISGGVFAVKRECMARAKELIWRFQVELCELCEDRDADEVYQLEVAFFPLTRSRIGGASCKE